jgi:hypothetical protein
VLRLALSLGTSSPAIGFEFLFYVQWFKQLLVNSHAFILTSATTFPVAQVNNAKTI